MPVVIIGEKFLGIFEPELRLVGFKRLKVSTLDSDHSKNYIIFYYANISHMGFVEGHLKNKKSLKEYKDSYLNKNILNILDIDEFTINKESFTIKMETNIVKNTLMK